MVSRGWLLMVLWGCVVDDVDPTDGDTESTDESDVGGDTVVDTDETDDSDPPDESDVVVEPPAPGRSIETLVGEAVLVPAGTFTMGCEVGRDDDVGGCFEWEYPARAVTITRAFWMMRTEMTQVRWASLGYVNPSATRGDDHPVEQIGWWDVVSAANDASIAEGLTPCYQLLSCSVEPPGQGRSCVGVSVDTLTRHPSECEGWRLPTEAEWEYAARADRQFRYAGSDVLRAVGWYGENSDGSTQPVCTRAPNRFGLCDLSGNVFELVWDGFVAYAGGPQEDPQSPSPMDRENQRVLRGGGWTSTERFSRLSHRGGISPTSRHPFLGFRLVRTARVEELP